MEWSCDKKEFRLSDSRGVLECVMTHPRIDLPRSVHCLRDNCLHHICLKHSENGPSPHPFWIATGGKRMRASLIASSDDEKELLMGPLVH